MSRVTDILATVKNSFRIKLATLDASGLTAARTFTLPDLTGTIALKEWTDLVLGSQFDTSSSSAVDVTGWSFTPAANIRYEFEAIMMVRTATATTGPRPGLAWPTGGTDGVADVQVTSSASGVVRTLGNINAAILAPVGGLPNTTQSWPAFLYGNFVAGGSPSGTVKMQLASESGGTTVSIMPGSLFRYRPY